MTTIKTNLSSENVCGLKIENTTGYYSNSNPTGFLAPTDIVVGIKNYYLNDIVLFTFLIKNNWNGTFSNLPISGNAGVIPVYDSTKSFGTLMDTLEITQHTFFSEDGYYSVYQLAIPKETSLNKPEAAAPNRYYVKPDGTVWLKTTIYGIDVSVNLYNDIISCNTNWASTNVIILRSNVVSKCFLENCFNSVLEVFSKYYTDPLCTKNDSALKTLREKRDLLFAVTNTIQYYVEAAQYYQAAKLIYDVSFCSICKDYILDNPTLNCNCRG